MPLKLLLILVLPTWAQYAQKEVQQFLSPLIPIYLLFVALVLVDLRLGVSAARKRGEPIRRSRAGRRTICKLMDYCSITTVCKMFDDYIVSLYQIPLVFITFCLLLAWVEIDSIFSHFSEIRGIKIMDFLREYFFIKLGITLPSKIKKNANNKEL